MDPIPRYYHKLLSQILSDLLSQLRSQLSKSWNHHFSDRWRYARVDTIPCRHSKSGHYPHLKLKRWHQHVQHARQRVHDQSQRQRVLVNLLVERNSDPAELDASVKEWTLSPFKAQALALSKSGNYRILRAWARSKSGNYRI